MIMAGVVNFSDEEEVQEYLNNTEIEFMFGCHKEKNEDSCYRLGEFLETIRKKFHEAAGVYKMCCDTWHSSTCCYKAGQYHMLGKGGLEKSNLRAYNSYRTACRQKNYADQGKNDRIAAACCSMSILLTSDQQVQEEFLSTPSDIPQSERLYNEIRNSFERACNLRDAAGCNFLSQVYLSGFLDKSKDFKLAAHYAEMACSLGEPRACHNLTIMYRRGEGVEKNLSKSEEFANRRNELMHGNAELAFSEP